MELASAQRIPIFFELRRYRPSQNFKQFLIDAIKNYGIECDDEVFDYLAGSGKIVFLLDAFDEVESDSVTHVTTELESLAQRFPRLQMVVTSRPDGELQNSAQFRVYQLAPLTPSDHKPFLDRIENNSQKVREIISAIKKSDAAIGSLLKTPLLLTLLVIVYNATQEIPSSLPEFYDALFQTLLTRHDKTKPGYRRPRKTRLSDLELKRLFEAFCYAVRQRDLLVLKEESADELLKKACAVTNLSAHVEGFLADVSKVACLMEQEGFEYHFIHKSVVEFHAACFIKNTSDEISSRFYGAMLNTKWRKWGQELEFLSQIDRNRYLRYFYIPSAMNMQQQLNFGVDSRAEISEAKAIQIANFIRVVSAPDSKEDVQQRSEISFTWGDHDEFLVNEFVMQVVHKLIRGKVNLTSGPRPVVEQIGLGDYFVDTDTRPVVVSAIRSVVEELRDTFERSNAQLESETHTTDFVAP